MSDKGARANDFQIVEKGSRLFDDVSGKGYRTWLSDKEIQEMNIKFQQRHLFEHNGGIIDEKYIQKSGDVSYKVGQRLVIHNDDVIQFVKLIKKLTDGLKQLQGSKK